MSMSSLEPYDSPRGRRAAEEERWHVRLAGDVKLMSVEQLDDAYRLSIVDGDTEVWKPGMARWQPLAIVAGLDDEEPEVTKVGPSPHDATPRVSVVPAAPALRSVPAPQPSSPPPPVRTIPPPPKLVVVKPPESPVKPAYVAPSATPAASAPVRTLPPAYAAPAYVPPSVPPIAYSAPPAAFVPRRSGSFGNWLLTAAFLGGTVVSLYRNDVLLDGARSLHRESQYLKIEARLFGGPLFGMLRATPTAGNERTSIASPAAAPEAPAPRVPEAASAPPGPVAATTESRAHHTELSELPVEPPPAGPKPDLGLPKTAPVIPRAEPSRTKSAARASRPVTSPSVASEPRHPKKRAAPSASDYDPLNPNL